MGAQAGAKDLERAEAAHHAQPLPDDFDFVSAGDAPLAIAEKLQEALSDQEPDDVPLIEEPGPDTVVLPGGLVIDGEVYQQATVRELNGEDEEHIARATLGNPVRFQQALLERGVVSIGPHTATEELLDRLLIGDRDTLFLGVRRATYGDTLDMEVSCGHCGVDSKIRVTCAEDIPIRPLPWDTRKTEHEIELRHGVAIARLATGAEQRYVYSLEGKTMAEMNTHLFAKCLISINSEPVDGRLEAVRKLGMQDRTTLLDWLVDSQPGPDYSAVKHTCIVCGKETPLNLQAEHLFPGL